MDFWLPLTMFAVVAAFTPGPNNIMILASGLNFGINASMPHYFGICFGFPVMFLAIGLGLGTAFDTWPRLHTIIQICGVFYLSYLAWRIASSRPDLDAKTRSKPFSFIQAVLFQWVNPKAWMTITSAIATYTMAGQPLLPQTIAMTLLFLFIAFPSAGSWLFLGKWLQALIQRPTHYQFFNRTMAILLIASISPVILGWIEAIVSA